MSDFQLFLISLGIAGIVYFTLVPPISLKQKSKRSGNRVGDHSPEPEKTYAEMKTLMEDINKTHDETKREKLEIEKTKLEMTGLMRALEYAHEETSRLHKEVCEENYLHEQRLRGLLIDNTVLKELAKSFPSSKYVLSSLVVTDMYATPPTSTVHILAVCKETGVSTSMNSDGSINLAVK